MARFDIPDARSFDPDDYIDDIRYRRMQQSWHRGVEKGNEDSLGIDEGFTWGSIGQILGYLLGDVDDSLKKQLYNQMLTQFKSTERGKDIR